MRIYLAGPLGFSEVGKSFHQEKIVKLLRELGHEILDPWELTSSSETAPILMMPYGADRKAAWEAINPTIGERNRLAIDDADAVFAVLDGVDVDSGTAAEIGYAFAKGKQIVGYRGDFRLSADNEGSVVNLQVEYFVRESGGQIIDSIAKLPAALQQLPQSGHSKPARNTVRLTIPAARMKGSQSGSGAAVIISLLLALIVRAAMEAIFKDPLQEGEAWPAGIVWFQLLVFFFLIVRFYLGATRFMDTQPKTSPLSVSAINVVFASLIFVTFYVIGLAVAEEEFFPFVVVMHAIDAVWFFIVLGWMRWANVPDMPGEIRAASNKRIMHFFLALSCLTIGLGVVLGGLVSYSVISRFYADVIFLTCLLVISIVDLAGLREYYFRHSQWIENNTA